MTVSIFAAAKRFGEKSGWSLSNLEMQKMLYLAHMFHLGRHGEPLVLGHFEAWDFGPVHPRLYHRLKIFGSSPVKNIFRFDGNGPTGEAAALIDEVSDSLSNTSSGRLVAITHWEEGAWSKNYVPGSRGVLIPNEDIIEEYQKRVQES